MTIKPIFKGSQLDKVDFILNNNSILPFRELFSSELKNLAIAWSYYSGKIEGNTYTYVETESLLKDNITSEKRYGDAKMLKNLYNTFVSEIEYIKKIEKEVIDEKLLFRIHRSITDGLISSEEQGLIRSRPVGITGTDYKPPRSRLEIQQNISEILFTQEGLRNPLERAVFLHCNLARIQPFVDGNKRTARMVESISLMNADIVPVFSTNEKDILDYRKGLIHFYETEDYSLYADYFLNKKISYLQEIEPNLLKKNDLRL